MIGDLASMIDSTSMIGKNHESMIVTPITGIFLRLRYLRHCATVATRLTVRYVSSWTPLRHVALFWHYCHSLITWHELRWRVIGQQVAIDFNNQANPHSTDLVFQRSFWTKLHFSNFCPLLPLIFELNIVAPSKISTHSGFFDVIYHIIRACQSFTCISTRQQCTRRLMNWLKLRYRALSTSCRRHFFKHFKKQSNQRLDASGSGPWHSA